MMSTSFTDENSDVYPLCYSRSGTVATVGYETPSTGYEPKESELIDTDERNLTTSDVYWPALENDTLLDDTPNDVNDDQLANYLAIVVDNTGQPVVSSPSKRNDQFSGDKRNVKSAQFHFPSVTPNVISQFLGPGPASFPEERDAQAQIRTMLDEQRKTILAECRDKVLHHELLAAHAE